MKKRNRISWLVPAMLSFATAMLAFISDAVNQAPILYLSRLLSFAGGIRCVCLCTKQHRQQDKEQPLLMFLLTDSLY